jgi:alanyl-tRNA synthetase
MAILSTTQIREKFLSYFERQGHTRVESSSLIPGNDPTLLFTNAGMVQFKDIFLGQDKRSYVRATSSQRCVRAGGKHNDLENVGYTARHHTFFEMLGNFSFGDYFKRDAIRFAWEFLTLELGLPKEKLWVSVFKDDDEAHDIWVKEIGFDPTRISRCGEKDNFWMMGDTGPCGPCSEIFYDHGEHIWGGPPGSPEADGDRYIEIWNMVFMQYQRFADGSQTRLPKPSIDTGMGLERLAAVMQGVHENYEIDLFQHLIGAVEKVTRHGERGRDEVNPFPSLIGGGSTFVKTHEGDKSLRVIADHIRSASFLVLDGVMPSNEGRGYVLRRIIRRALRHGHKLGMTQTFFYKLVTPLAEVMAEAYPELSNKKAFIEKVLKQEEEQFAVTLEKGLKILESAIAVVASVAKPFSSSDVADFQTSELPPSLRSLPMTGTIIPGDIVFKLYDTYGFPIDLTADIAREKNLELDIAGFEKAMEVQRKKSQSASQFAVDYNQQLKTDHTTQFTGYDSLEEHAALIVALFKGNTSVATLTENEQGVVVLDRSPFYAEGGGQVGDQGFLQIQENIFEVADTKKAAQSHLHHGLLLKGSLSVGDVVHAQVKQVDREAIKRNHSATHLLHATLRYVLGEHVHQRGSLVNSERLRFDFSHNAAMTADELKQVENCVNEKIQDNLCVEAKVMSAEMAKKTGAMALFGEKYGDEVRVLTMGGFSIELCGGMHVNRTVDIEVFKVIKESGIASGVRRIEAITGTAALAVFEAEVTRERDLLQRQMVEKKALLKQTEEQQHTLLPEERDKAIQAIESSENFNVLLFKSVLDTKLLRSLIDAVKPAVEKGIMIIWNNEAEKVNLVVAVTDNLTSSIKANDLVKLIAELISGRGGGKANFAQCAGNYSGERVELEKVLMDMVKKY